MKQLLLYCSLIVFLIMPFATAQAVHVSGYYRSNGTYVQPYERTAPDGIPYNNYGYPGNYNPNTGNITGGSQTTYLDNYYGISGSSYSAPTYSYPITPTCPLNSYYNGSSCTCSSGYVVGTDYLGSQSCVSGYTKCTDSMGTGAQYNSVSNTCSCGYGYVQSAGKCVSTITYCTNLIGLMSQYNTLTNQCECMSGYQFDGSSCVYMSTNTYNYSPSSTYNPTAQACPVNSTRSSTDLKCHCNSGYQNDSTNTACVLISVPQCPAGTSPNGNSCACAYGSVFKNGQCYTNTNDCKLSFGDNVVGVPGLNNNSSCSCAEGYVWNPNQTACVLALTGSVTNAAGNSDPKVVFQSVLLFGTRGVEVTQLQDLLRKKGLFTASSSGYFGNITKSALVKYQTTHGLPGTGVVDLTTKNLLNAEWAASQ